MKDLPGCAELIGRVETVRRISAAEGMLLATVTIWAFNFTVTRYAVTHGFQPLAYSALRFSAAALVVSGITYRWEGSLRFQRRHAVFLAGAAFIGIYLKNLIGFMYAIDLTNASTVALIFGSLPIVTAIVAYAFGVERLHRRFWVAAAISFFGVALVAAGSATSVLGEPARKSARPPRRGDLGFLLGRDRAAAPPLLGLADQRGRARVRRRSARDHGDSGSLDQDWDLEPLVWAGFAFAVVGPLVLTNFLWFTAIERVGPSRATLVTNLQPFLATLFAVVLLSEELTWLQVAGGVTMGSRSSSPGVDLRSSRRDRGTRRRSRRPSGSLAEADPDSRIRPGVPCDCRARRRLDGVRQGGGGGRDERVPAARDPLLRSRAGLVDADASGL